MPKRKLSDITETGGGERGKSQSPQDRALSLQTTRLKQKFEYGVTTLYRALKTARGFERQKLGRREKTAKSAGDEGALRRIEGEIKVLKGLDLHITAAKYLFKQLVKTKRIAEAPVFVRFRESKKIPVEGPRSTEEANVTARLYKSNPVKNVLPGIMDGIRSLLGLEASTGNNTKGAKADSKGKADKKREKSVQRRTDSEFSGSEEEEDDEDGDRVGRDVDVDMEDAESDEEDYSRFDARLASDSEEEEGDGDSDVSDAAFAHTNSKPPARRDMSVSLSPEPESPESPPQKKQKSKGSSQKASATPATSTTFLPSLMMGGYWSGSESEAEDIGREEPPRRKNRMGQQARRALWEKKYGARANHLQKQKGKKDSRDSGWDPRKGATGDDDRGRRKYGTGSNALATTGNRSHLGEDNSQRSSGGTNKKPQDDKPLHPSWEAARKAKEQKASASFQGKKVVFD